MYKKIVHEIKKRPLTEIADTLSRPLDWTCFLTMFATLLMGIAAFLQIIPFIWVWLIGGIGLGLGFVLVEISFFLCEMERRRRPTGTRVPDYPCVIVSWV